jgi:hypothetical protein
MVGGCGNDRVHSASPPMVTAVSSLPASCDSPAHCRSARHASKCASHRIALPAAHCVLLLLLLSALTGADDYDVAEHRYAAHSAAHRHHFDQGTVRLVYPQEGHVCRRHALAHENAPAMVVTAGVSAVCAGARAARNARCSLRSRIDGYARYQQVEVDHRTVCQSHAHAEVPAAIDGDNVRPCPVAR